MLIGDGEPKDGRKRVTICKFGGEEEEGMTRVGIILEGVRTVDRNRKKHKVDFTLVEKIRGRIM
jgi:hypothetical protein